MGKMKSISLDIERLNAGIKYLEEMLNEYQIELESEGTCPAEAFVACTAYQLLTGEPHPLEETLGDIIWEDREEIEGYPADEDDTDPDNTLN